MSDDPESGGSGGGGTVNYNNNYAPSSLKDDNDENKYRTKDNEFSLGTMRQLLFLFTQRKREWRLRLSIFRRGYVFSIVSLKSSLRTEEESGTRTDHPGSLLSTTTTRGVGKSCKNNNKYHPLRWRGQHVSISRVRQFSHRHWALRVFWKRLHARWRRKFMVSRRVSNMREQQSFGRTVKVGVETAARDGKAILLLRW